MKSIRMLRLFAVMLAASVLPSTHAQTIQFDNGGGTGLWSAATNWAGDVLPGSANSADIRYFNTTVDSTFPVYGVSMSSTNGVLNIAPGANLTVGGGAISTGRGMLINQTGGTATVWRVLSSPSLANYVGQLTISGGTFTVTNRINLTSSTATATARNGFSLSGGNLVMAGAAGGFTLFGADADDRPSFKIIGSAGSFASASGRCAVTLANTANASPAATAASVEFTLLGTSVTTVFASNLTLASNPLTIDLTNLNVPSGTHTYTLFDYSGTLTGSFAAPTFIGLKPSQQVTFTNDVGGKKITLTVTTSFDVADFNLPPQDASGWTILQTASDSRLVYVDPVNGVDSSGTYYAPGSATIGSNPQMPVGAVAAYQTITAAQAALRSDKPDWLLLKAGGVFTSSLPLKRGRSPSDRAVICSYGTGARPELRTGTTYGISSHQASNVIISGIKFWAHTRDTDGPYFTGYNGSSGFNFFTAQVGDVRLVSDILIEDCVFRTYTGNVLTGGTSPNNNAPITRFALRRSIISGNYSNNAHSQGLYYDGSGQAIAPHILLQENTFDHNGWRVQPYTGIASDPTAGQATMYNHNTYFTNATGVLFEGNHFLRASSIGNKWTANSGSASARQIVMDNNFYNEGEVGIGIGGNTAGPLRFDDIIIRNNVMSDIGRGLPTLRYFSWGLAVDDWNYGDIVDNLIVHQRRTDITNTYGMVFTAVSASNDILVSGNIIADLYAGTATNSALVRFQNGANTTNLQFVDNIVQSPSATPLASIDPGGFIVSGTNRYYSAALGTKLFVVSGTFKDLSAWQAATGDNGAVTTPPVFPAPTRDVESYMTSLGLGSTFQDFLNALYNQSRASWNPDLTAPAVNNWIRAGFGMAPVN